MFFWPSGLVPEGFLFLPGEAMLKRGFTLIELLVVVTIVATLVGVVIPYVQRYVEDARIAKVKRDLDTIKSALMRYENDQRHLYTENSIHRLVGSYLNRPLVDAWGKPYFVSNEFSQCYSLGPDRVDNSGDEIRHYFRPPLAISRVYLIDNNKNSLLDGGDALQIKFTRPLRRLAGDGPTASPIEEDDFRYSGIGPDQPYVDLVEDDFSLDRMSVRLTLGAGVTTSLKPDKDTIWAKVDNRIVDGEGIPCLYEQPVLIRSY